jgi:hypothetical protein
MDEECESPLDELEIQAGDDTWVAEHPTVGVSAFEMCD